VGSIDLKTHEVRAIKLTTNKQQRVTRFNFVCLFVRDIACLVSERGTNNGETQTKDHTEAGRATDQSVVNKRTC
jgi:hypothetical protein